jgi:hypothetical protein
MDFLFDCKPTTESQQSKLSKPYPQCCKRKIPQIQSRNAQLNYSSSWQSLQTKSLFTIRDQAIKSRSVFKRGTDFLTDDRMSQFLLSVIDDLITDADWKILATDLFRSGWTNCFAPTNGFGETGSSSETIVRIVR